MLNAAFLMFPGVEELDMVGPWQVFQSAAREGYELNCFTVAEEESPVTASKGLKLLPDFTMGNAPRIDILIIPGGVGIDQQRYNTRLVDWISRTAENTKWMLSVCSGVILLLEAGPAQGKEITSHHARLKQLAKDPRVGSVKGEERYIRDGQIVTAAGVTAGIDMSLWFIGTIFTEEATRKVISRMQYDPKPPFV